MPDITITEQLRADPRVVQLLVDRTRGSIAGILKDEDMRALGYNVPDGYLLRAWPFENRQGHDGFIKWAQTGEGGPKPILFDSGWTKADWIVFGAVGALATATLLLPALGIGGAGAAAAGSGGGAAAAVGGGGAAATAAAIAAAAAPLARTAGSIITAARSAPTTTATPPPPAAPASAAWTLSPAEWFTLALVAGVFLLHPSK